MVPAPRLIPYERLVKADALADILSSIERIERFTVGIAAADLAGNQVRLDAVLHHFDVIGESSRALAKRLPDVARELGLPTGLGYPVSLADGPEAHGARMQEVWAALNTLPSLKAKVATAL